MAYLVILLKIIHFFGFASVFGGIIVQLKSPQKAVNGAMTHGALTQLASGIFLTALLANVNYLKVSIKAALIIVLLGVLFGFRKKILPVWAYWFAAVIVLAEAAIAVLW